MKDRPGRELASMAQAFLTQKHAVPGWAIVSVGLCILLVALIARRSAPERVAADNADSVVAASPFRCTADRFEAAAASWGMPFKPNRRNDARPLCRVSKSAATDYALGRDIWLCRQSGKVRGVQYKWGRLRRYTGLREADQDDINLFREIAGELFTEESAIELMRWFIVSGPLLDQFQATTDLVRDTHPSGRADMACVKDGVRVMYRKLAMSDVTVIHVVSFEIDRVMPDWPPGPYGAD